MTPRLHIDGPLRPGRLRVAGDDHHHLFRVLRLSTGAAITVFDGAGNEASATVVRVDAGDAELEVGEVRAASASGPQVTALVPLIKGDRTDLAITKLVELGVRRIVPVRTERSVVRLAGARAEARQQRYQKLAVAAAKQCRATHLCQVAALADFGDAVAACDADLRLLAYEGVEVVPLADAIAAGPHASVAFATGPEGGFSDAEVAAARAAGFVAVGLGPRILRAETAAIALAAILDHALRHSEIV